MKQLFSFLAAGLLATAAWGQTTVTLTVDMTNEEVSADGMHVAGNFQGWQAGDTPMTDNLDGTYSHTFTVDSAMTIQYKFINGNAWGSDESVPGACAFDGNRQLVVDGMMGSDSTLACYGNCAACGLTTVRFRVDMTNEEVSSFGVHVAGDFQGWEPAGTPMTDEDGDMVYEAIASFDATDMDGISYKFINGNAWTDPNELVEGDCGDENGNRVLALDGTDLVVARTMQARLTTSFCSSCVLPLAVTFTVDMSVVTSVSDRCTWLAHSRAGIPLALLWQTTAMAPGASRWKLLQARMSSSSSIAMHGMATKRTWRALVATMEATASLPSKQVTRSMLHASILAQVWPARQTPIRPTSRSGSTCLSKPSRKTTLSLFGVDSLDGKVAPSP